MGRQIAFFALCVAGCGGGAAGPADFAFAGGDGGGPGPAIGNCPVFPAPAGNSPTGLEDEWNRDVSADPVDPMSDAYLANMNAATKKLHPDFGSDPTYGIPWITVPSTQAKVPIAFTYADESDPGPYPFPMDAPVEGGPGATGDRHVLVVDRDNCILYETFNSSYVGPGWMCDSGAVWNRKSTKLRPETWTSADAAGLPILPGLVRRDEAMAGEIKHAFRFTVAKSQKGYVHPATHQAGSTSDPSFPPMGLRVRLKAGYDTSRLTGLSKVIVATMKKYGLILADNGSDWYVSGETNTMWDDNDLDQIKAIPANQFEVVKSGPVMH